MWLFIHCSEPDAYLFTTRIIEHLQRQVSVDDISHQKAAFFQVEIRWFDITHYLLKCTKNLCGWLLCPDKQQNMKTLQVHSVVSQRQHCCFLCTFKYQSHMVLNTFSRHQILPSCVCHSEVCACFFFGRTGTDSPVIFTGKAQ